MYKIGEFSRITGLSIRTLRYYDSENLLVPTARLDNGYRLYSEEDYKKAEIIRSLKELHFTINEITVLLPNIGNHNELYEQLGNKKKQILEKIVIEKEVLRKISNRMIEIERGSLVRMYEFKEKSYDDIVVLSKKFVGSVNDTKDIIPNLYKRAGMSVNGEMFTLYYDMGFSDESNIEICVPVRKDLGNDEFEYKKIDGGLALSTTHIGPYENLSKAYKSLIDYSKKNEIEIGLPAREICIKGPGMFRKGNPEKYITEISFPIIKK